MVTLRMIDPVVVASFKAVRLAALQDAPTAFGSTYARESRMSDAEWAQRVAQWNGDRSACYLAWDGDQPCGIAAGFLEREVAGRAHLVSMWVAPTHRRRGVGRRLVGAVADWARGLRAQSLYLMVTSNNDAATRFYERLGFGKTGRTQPYPNDPGLMEFEMVLPLAPPDGTAAG